MHFPFESSRLSVLNGFCKPVTLLIWNLLLIKRKDFWKTLEICRELSSILAWIFLYGDLIATMMQSVRNLDHSEKKDKILKYLKYLLNNCRCQFYVVNLELFNFSNKCNSVLGKRLSVHVQRFHKFSYIVLSVSTYPE